MCSPHWRQPYRHPPATGFLRLVASKLAAYPPEVRGPGLVHRVATEAQRGLGRFATWHAFRVVCHLQHLARVLINADRRIRPSDRFEAERIGVRRRGVEQTNGVRIGAGGHVVEQDTQEVGISRCFRRDDDRQWLKLRRGRGFQSLEQFRARFFGERPNSGVTIVRELSIFLVEDEALIRMMTAEMVEGLGHRVVAEAGSIAAAMPLAQKVNFDLAILDINVDSYSLSSAGANPVS